MKLKTLTVGAVALVALIAGECADKPAGSDQGDSAGNNQPGGGGEQCTKPKGNYGIVAQRFELAGPLKYSASAYLMDGECEIIDITDEKLLKVTLVAIDSRGSRVDPKLNNSPQPSPFGAIVSFALPTNYSLELVVTGNMNSAQVKDSETIFIGCSLIPASKGDSSTNIADIGGGKGKAQCRVTG